MYINNSLLPCYNANLFIGGDIGISYCMRTNLFHQGYEFKLTKAQDYELFNRMINNDVKIVVSSFITYYVGDFYLTPLNIKYLEKRNNTLLINYYENCHLFNGISV